MHLTERWKILTWSSLPWQTQPVWSLAQGQAAHLNHSFLYYFFFLFLCIQTTDTIKAKCFFVCFFSPISVIEGTIGKTKAALADYH